MFTEGDEPPTEFGERFIVHQFKTRAENSEHGAAGRIHRPVVMAGWLVEIAVHDNGAAPGLPGPGGKARVAALRPFCRELHRHRAQVLPSRLPSFTTVLRFGRNEIAEIRPIDPTPVGKTEYSPSPGRYSGGTVTFSRSVPVGGVSGTGAPPDGSNSSSRH